MRQLWRARSYVLLTAGVIGSVALVIVQPSGIWTPLWYLGIAALGTSMAVAGAVHRSKAERRIWVAIGVGQVLYLAGDALWYMYKNLLSTVPYPSFADVAYLLRYGALLLGLCWLVQRRRTGRDRAAFLDAAIISSAFALLATVFLIVPATRGTGVSLLSRVVAAAYPVGDVLVLAVLVQLAGRRRVRNLAFGALAGGLVILLAIDVVYTLVVASDRTLPAWSPVGYLLPYLLIGFAAMQPAGESLAEATPDHDRSPTARKVVALGGALVLGPTLLAVRYLCGAPLDPLVISVGTIVSCFLVLARLLDLFRLGEAQSQQLTALARTDSLTGVANRRSWDHELARAAVAAESTGTPLAVVVVDLDQFKNYNDEYGHIAGDQVLRDTAGAWAKILDGRGFVARYGGEEFAFLLPRTALALAEPLLYLLHRSVAGGQTCSMGVTEWQPGEDPSEATARADEAMYEAKRAGRNQISVHDRAGLRLLPRQTALALVPEITPVFQPIVDIQTGATVGHEALSRFVGMTPTDAFAEARRNGTTASLEIAAIDAALQAPRPPGFLSLNVGLSTLFQSEIDQVLPYDLSEIVLEITEYEYHLDTPAAVLRLAELRGRGARIAIDDLGVGFSNLNRLLWLAPEIIKLDMSVVREVHTKSGHLAMVRALGVYAEACGARLCAEGIETSDEWHALADAGVALGQGYLFGRPQPAISMSHLPTQVPAA
ncbi:MAG: diguanylate cyclase [Frankiaceae bacterium]|jgi:diguanylate cyclase (GGDEF)-like protein|nr:diguanylate cyclase [Frankiaceae bacterium]